MVDNELKCETESELQTLLEGLWGDARQVLDTLTEDLTKEDVDRLAELILKVSEVLVQASCRDNLVEACCVFCRQHDPYNEVYRWTGDHREHLRRMASVQLNYFKNLVENADTKVLLCKEVIIPLLLILLSLRPNDKRKIPSDVELLYVQILYFISYRISNKEFLNMLSHDMYTGGEDFKIPRFTFFELLLLYTHKYGQPSDLARSAIISCLKIAVHDEPLNNYICHQTSACVIIAGGLSAHYSSLPSTLELTEDWCNITQAQLDNMKELQAFLHTLTFCSNVLSSHNTRFSTKLLQLIYDGFLMSVLAPAVSQPTVDAQIAAISYLELFIRSISSERLMELFLRVLLTDAYDNKPIIDILVVSINSNNEQLSMVTIQLFITLLELNCEDVLFQLAFRYLLPCNHVLPNQKKTIKEMDFYCKSATMFLYLTPKVCLQTTPPPDESPTPSRNSFNGTPPVNRRETLDTLSSDTASLDSLPADMLSSYEFMSYLIDAKVVIMQCKRACKCWSNVYDGMDVVSEVLVERTARARSPSVVSAPLYHTNDLPQFPPVDDCLGLFINTLFDKLEGMMENSVYLNLQLTSLVARLACFPQPLLRSFLLNSNLVIQPGVRSLSRVLSRVSVSIDNFVSDLHDYSSLIKKARENLIRREQRKFKHLSANLETSEFSVDIDTSTGASNFSVSSEQKGRVEDDIMSLTPSGINSSPSEESRRTCTFSTRQGMLHPAIPKFNTRTSPNRKDKRQTEKPSVKNAVYCAIILEEFTKELAAISIEQTLL